MKLLVRIEQSEDNNVEFDAGTSDLSQLDALKKIVELAQNCIKIMEGE